jgi:crossover junction endodeoxyribonuclease RuvC
MKVGGIDPGLSGALALIADSEVKFFDKYIYKIGGKSEYDIPVMRSLLVSERPDIVYIERAQAMPKQGVVSMFKIGYGFGLWIGLLSALEIPYEIVRPQIWQNTFFSGMSKDDTKKMAYKVSSALYPKIVTDLKGPRGGLLDGRSDALLIATYGLRKQSPYEKSETKDQF